MTTILIKKKDTAGAPGAGDLTNAAGGTEIAVNTATKRIYSKDSGGNVIELGTNPSGTTMAGNLLFSPDNTYDIGASGATRARTLYLGTSLVTPAITNSGLTSGRVVYSTTGGLETDSANLTFDGTNLGVGVTSASYKLDVQGASGVGIQLYETSSGNNSRLIISQTGTATTYNSTYTTPASQAQVWQIGNSEKMRLTFAGSVGIGTDTPLSKFDLRDGYITAGTTTATGGPKILGGYYSSGSLTTLGSDFGTGGPVLGYAVWPSTATSGAHTSATGIAISRGAYSIAGNTHTWYIGASQTVAIGSAVTTSAAMTLDGSGNLGIGVTAPQEKLEVKSATSTQILVGAGTGFTYGIGRETVNGFLRFYGNQSGAIGYIFTGADGERMRIDASGNVGIGTNSPSTYGKAGIVTSAGSGNGGPASAIANASLSLGATATSGVLAMGVDATGTYYSWIQSTTTGNSAIYSLALNPSGGNVGIGVTAPLTKLSIKTDTDFVVGIGTTSANTGARVAALNLAQNAYKDLVIDGATVGLAVSGTTVMLLDASGRLRGNSGAGGAVGFYPYYNSATSYNAVGSDANGGLTFTTGVSSPAVRATITNVGPLQLPYQPAFEAYGSGNQNWSVGTAYNQTLQLNTRSGGMGSNRYSGYSTSTYRFTAPVAGVYFFYLSYTQTSATGGPEAFFLINSGTNYRNIAIGYQSVTGYFTASGNATINMAAGDYVEVQLVNNNGVALQIDLTRSVFGGHLLG